MDSKVVNKLIRSEVWPLLREQGFTKFESRNACRYAGPFINVVTFHSMNSYTAEVIDCTTFSFGLSIGVYVIGSDGERHIKRDAAGRLLPRYYHCSFQAALEKRTPIDGFARKDIFYIDPDGHTAGPCFREVQHLLTAVAPRWFAPHTDLDTLIAWISGAAPSEPLPPEASPVMDVRHCWYDCQATLFLLKHLESPTPQTAEPAFRAIDRVIGNVFDWSPLIDPGAGREEEVRRIRQLWDRLGPFAPLPKSTTRPPASHGSLLDPIWTTPPPEPASRPNTNPPPLSTRKQLWPALRSQGFSEFSDRLAHRAFPDRVEVVGVTPIDRLERKRRGLPEGIFRLGVGVFWHKLQEFDHTRTNRAGQLRPRLEQCHLSCWLLPERLSWAAVPSAFDSPEDARAALSGPAVRWFKSFGTPESALSILQLDNWEIFWHFPMTRQAGARSSTRRLLYLANLASQLHRFDEARDYLRLAETAIDDHYRENERPRYRKWLDAARAKLTL